MANNVCPTCGKEVGEQGHMCVPMKQSDEKCDWCGSLIPDARHLCSEKVKELSYICIAAVARQSATNICASRRK